MRLLTLCLLAASLPALAQFGPDKPYKVPSDAKATYTNLSIEGAGRHRKITTLRNGPSGDGYSLREYDCERGRVRYLATGDTLAELKAIKPGNWADVVDGSIASYVGGQACHGYRRQPLKAPKK